MPSTLVLTSRSAARRSAVEPDQGTARESGAEMRRQRLGATQRSIDDRDMLEARATERVDDRTRRAARADHDSQFGRPRPARRAFVHVGQKARDVGVVAPEKPVLAPQRVHCAERLCDRRPSVAETRRRPPCEAP